MYKRQVLNLTIESAPTKPKESANDDLTTTIIIVVPILKIGSTLANVSGLEKLFDCARYIFDSKNERIKDRKIEIIKLPMETLISQCSRESAQSPRCNTMWKYQKRDHISLPPHSPFESIGTRISQDR